MVGPQASNGSQRLIQGLMLLMGAWKKTRKLPCECTPYPLILRQPMMVSYWEHLLSGGLGGRGGGPSRLVPTTTRRSVLQPDGPYCNQRLILGKPRRSLSQPVINFKDSKIRRIGFVFRVKEISFNFRRHDL